LIDSKAESRIYIAQWAGSISGTELAKYPNRGIPRACTLDQIESFFQSAAAQRQDCHKMDGVGLVGLLFEDSVALPSFRSSNLRIELFPSSAQLKSQ
jgi:hypothetical protein